MIGSIFRQGTKAEKHAMDEFLQNDKIHDDDTCRSEVTEPMSERPRLPGGGIRRVHSPARLESSERIPYVYTMILKEEGDRSSLQPIYTAQQISVVPPEFKVAVNFRGIDFFGRGTTKRQAKHEASKAACESLGLTAL